jgi:hypothetical protein
MDGRTEETAFEIEGRAEETEETAFEMEGRAEETAFETDGRTDESDEAALERTGRGPPAAAFAVVVVVEVFVFPKTCRALERTPPSCA